MLWSLSLQFFSICVFVCLSLWVHRRKWFWSLIQQEYRLTYHDHLITFSFFNVVWSLSHVQLSATPWIVDCQAPLSSTIPEFAQIHVHWVSDANQPSHLLSLPSSAFFSCPPSFPPSTSFPMSWLFASGGQSIGDSASATVIPMNIQDWFLLGLTGGIFLLSKGFFKSLLQHHYLKVSVLWHSAFFIIQLSHIFMSTGKPVALTIWTFVSKLMFLLSIMLSRVARALLPRIRHL